MILINLLPHREAARKRRREMFYAALGASAVAGFVIAGGIWLWYGAMIANQQDRNQILSREIQRLEAQIKDIKTLQEEIAALRARQQAVEDLQADRNMPVHLLNELVRQLPDGVYITNMKQSGNVVAIAGVAQSNERVSELLRNLSAGPWLVRPDLAEIVAGNVMVGREQRRIANFRMNVRLLRASEVQKAASAAASAAVPTAAPAASAAAVAAATPAPAPAPQAAPATPAPVAAANPAATASAKK